jgi:hypothetical protein
MSMKSLALFAVLMLPMAAQAEPVSHSRGTSYDRYSPLSYTHGELRLVAEDPDGRDDADGVSLAGSVLLQPQLFIAGGYTSLGAGSDNGLDEDTLELDVGFRHPFTSQVDLIGMAGLVRVDRDVGRFHDDDIGPSITGGTRVALTSMVEIGGFVNYTQVFGDGDLGVRGEGLYHVTPNLSVLAGLGLSDAARFANIGARWYFTPAR